MLQQIIHTFFKQDKKGVLAIIANIEIFYSYILKNGQLVDDWNLKNLFPNNYWSYLQSYNWLSKKYENYLHQGVLNFILFLSYQYLDNRGDHIKKSTQKVLNSIYSFSPKNKKTKKLHSFVIEALIMVKKKKQDNFNIENNSKILKSITWTLQNTILNIESQLFEKNDKNQR